MFRAILASLLASEVDCFRAVAALHSDHLSQVTLYLKQTNIS